MKSFKTENRFLNLSNEFRAVIRRMKTAFYGLDYQKLLVCWLIKRVGRAFVSKYAAEPLKSSAKLLKHSAELLKQSTELLRV